MGPAREIGLMMAGKRFTTIVIVLVFVCSLQAQEEISGGAIVRHFFDAHNRHDIDAIEASFGADAKLFASGSNLPLLEGRKAFGDFFRQRFARYPETKAEIKAVYEFKNIVIVHEEGVSSAAAAVRPVLDIFDVRGGVIRSVWAFEPRDPVPGEPDADEIVQLQLEKYNGKDLDGFLSTYSAEAVLFDLRTGGKIAEGTDALRTRYRERFETSPQLHAEILRRISVRNLVIDHERVVMGTESKTVDAVAIYDVESNLIRRVWFLMLN